MSQSLARLLTHIIFSTKNRVPVIVPEVQPRLSAYLAGTLKELESPALQVNCVSDHTHILCLLSKNHALAKVLEELKKGSSKWVKATWKNMHDFYWQTGYGAFSVSESNVDQVRGYILRQARHHRRLTFQEEFREFLRRHGIEFDERYIWD